MKVPIQKLYFDEEEKKAVLEVLESGWVVQGPKVAEFERMVAKYVGARFGLASTSCTTSLHLAMLALGIGPGDEFLLPSLTYIASANAIEYVGARPVFIDVDLDTFNIDPCKVEQYLEKAKKRNARVRGIMPVHLFGLIADMDPLLELAKAYNLVIIEDAACAMGSQRHGVFAGTYGEAGCFSFHPRKPVTTGEGGMLTTNDPEIAGLVQSYRDHGAAVTDITRHENGSYLLPAFNVLGYNYRMTDLQGAIGVVQMNKLDYILERRIARARIYDAALNSVPRLKTPLVPNGYRHSYQSYVTMFRESGNSKTTMESIDSLNRFRDGVMARLEQKGISSRQGTHAVHTLNYYKKKYHLKDEDYPNSLAADKLSMSIPLYAGMTDKEQDYVIDEIKAAFH